MLKDLLGLDAILQQPRDAGGHSCIMNTLFNGAKVIASYIEADYQGSEGFVYLLEDGRYVAVSDYFGSCSGCDAYEDASDEEIRNLVTQLANNAHVFDTLEQMIAFLEKEVPDDRGAYFDLQEVAAPLVIELRKLQAAQ